MKTKIFFLAVLFVGILGFGQNSLAYNPPVGIPVPGWGIDTPIYDSTTHCPAWPSADNSKTSGRSYDCYYVDNDSSACSDSGNDYGYPNKPRCTLPEGTFTAGAFVDVRGGTATPYTAGREIRIRGVGTSSDYILWTGANAAAKPKINQHVYIGEQSVEIGTSYVIFDNFDLIGSGQALGLEVRPNGTGANGVDHISVRNCTGTGSSSTGNPSFITVTGLTATSKATNVVVYNNTASHFGQYDATVENDHNGVILGTYVEDLWVLDNEFSYMGGDGVGGAHAADRRSTRIYIGGNTLHHNREHGIDIKEVDSVFISQNTIHDITTSSSAAGEGIVLHYGPNSGRGPRISWVMFNKIYTTDNGIIMSNAGLDASAYLIGNVMSDIHDRPQLGYGSLFNTWGGLGSIYAVDNTFYDYDKGITLSLIKTKVSIHGNIFQNRTDASRYELETDDPAINAISDIDYNQFYANQGGKDLSIKWYGTYYTTLDSPGFKATGECAHCAVGLPKLSNPPASFTLASDSPCIGVSAKEATVYDKYYADYGLSIQKDITGTARPYGSTWDIGAYEYSSSSTDTTPPAVPSGLTVN